MHALVVCSGGMCENVLCGVTSHSTAPPGRPAQRSGPRTPPSACLWPRDRFLPSRFWRYPTRGPSPSPPRRMSGTAPRWCGPKRELRPASAAGLRCRSALLGGVVLAPVLVLLLLLSGPAREWCRQGWRVPGAGVDHFEYF